MSSEEPTPKQVSVGEKLSSVIVTPAIIAIWGAVAAVVVSAAIKLYSLL